MLGFELVGGPPAQVTKAIRADHESYAEIVAHEDFARLTSGVPADRYLTRGDQRARITFGCSRAVRARSTLAECRVREEVLVLRWL